MRKSTAWSIVSVLLAAPCLLVATPAKAGIDACGNIDVEAQETCTVEAQGCDVQCAPVKLQVACSARLETTCEASCTGSAEVSCTGTCQGTCEAECTKVTAPMFDCEGQCKVDAVAECSGECSGQAAGSEAKGQCEASCKATFSSHCHAKCTGTPPSADCKAKCEGRCQGSCTAKSNLKCQVDCQTQGYAACETELQGGCKADCSQAGGALFCNGNYVDHGGKLQDCVDALNAVLNVKVQGTASSSSSCDGGTCQAQAEAQGSATCAMSPASPRSSAWGWLGALAAASLIAVRRRSR